MAYNQSFQPVKSGLVSSYSTSNVAGLSTNTSQQSSRYGELSSSGAGSDWVVFSPSVGEEAEEYEEEEEEDDDGDEQEEEVLSTTNEVSQGDSVAAEDEKEEYAQDDDDDDDADSLIDSLDTAHDIKLSFPTHDGSGNFMNSYNEQEHNSIFNNDLSKEEFITSRIDSWRREQARLLIEELQNSNSSNASLSQENNPSHVDELLASWGVDDRDPIESKLDRDHDQVFATKVNDQSTTSKTSGGAKPYVHGSKRFYGDDIFENYSEWEVSMIKKVAHQLSSSLVRDRRQSSNLDHHTGLRSRRSSLLSNLSKNAINAYLSGSNSYFWKKDLSSAHSSISTNSMLFGNSWGDVM